MLPKDVRGAVVYQELSLVSQPPVTENPVLTRLPRWGCSRFASRAAS
jgi:ABC-type sugar transport system ATPase subunit